VNTEVMIEHQVRVKMLKRMIEGANDDDDCFYYYSWRNNVVIAFETLLSFLTQFLIVKGIVCVV